ncbi:MAG: transposase [Afipia sp.]|nr:transposase [Afipia sp.]
MMGIPGIGVLTATALVAAVGNARTFTRGRDLAAWELDDRGLLPSGRQTSSLTRFLGPRRSCPGVGRSARPS